MKREATPVDGKQTPMTPELRDQLTRRMASLELERSSWIAHWKDISTFVLPRSGRYFLSDRNQGGKRHNNIYDSTGTRALRVLAAGLMGGATSPARPWFRLQTSNPDLNKLAPVKLWLSSASAILLDVFSRSNVYRVLHSMYQELGAFGTAAAILVDDYETGIRLIPLTAGEYCIATNFNGDVTTLFRKLDMTVGALVREFKYENCSTVTKSNYDNGNLDAWVTIVHCVEPRYDRDPKMLDAKNMAWRSVYYEEGGDKDKVLREGGMKSFRALCPRWDVSGGDIYGNSPIMECLGDIKQLQHEQLRKAEAIDYQTKPPLQVPTSMKNHDVNRLPGGISTVDMAGPNSGVKTLFDVNLRLDYLLSDIQDVRQRINETCYTDLFLMLSSQDQSKMTATEVAERHEEKLLMLGPVLERLHNELLDPLVSMTFQRLLETGMLPEIPQELHDEDLNIDFISMLAQAQRAVSTNGVDRYTAAMGQIAEFKPEILDRFDADAWADIYGDMLGVDPKLIVPLDDANKTRDARAAAQQKAAQAEQIQQGADAANKLANAPTNNKNALTDVTQMFSGYTTPQGNA